MPFTLSHPAVVLPLARGPFVPSALVMGAVAPDFPYFVGLDEQRELTHEWVHVWSVDVGLAMVLLVLFHTVLKWPLIALCPAWIRSRVAKAARKFDGRPMRDIGWMVLSALIGAFSHVAWDAFTHANAPGVRWFPVLAEPAVFGLPGFRVAQYASGIGGAVVIAVWLLIWLRRAEPTAPVEPVPAGLSVRLRSFVFALTAAAAGAGAWYGAYLWLPLSGGGTREDFHARLVGAVIGAIAFAAVALLAYALVIRAQPRAS